MTDYLSRTAVISGCGQYRYRLGRSWAADTSPGRTVAFVMLNPSTADAMVDDPTIRRCVGFARDWGFAALEVVNLLAYRATNPRDLVAVRDPFGPYNPGHLADAVREADLVVAAWGASFPQQLAWSVDVTAALLRDRGAHHLGLTAAGHPRHPLYLRADTQPVRWVA